MPPDPTTPPPPPAPSLPPNPGAASRTSTAAQQEQEAGKVFPGYREFVQLKQRGTDLRKRIDALTIELTDARKAPASTAQKVQLHQLNNALHRAGYEFDTVIEDYKQRMIDLVEDASVDWIRAKSNWIQNEDQIFVLQMLQAKCAFLRQGGDQFQEEAEAAFKAVDELEDDLNHFANSHLSAGSLPDDALVHFSQLVATLSRILVSAHEVATETPEWRTVLKTPPPGSLSIAFLKDASESIQDRIKQIPFDINATRRLLPGGSWRKESDLRPEIYAFASLLYPSDPIHRINVRDTLLYLDDDPDCRLRKLQVAELQADEAKVKEWTEMRGQHVKLIDKARALAKEGNYRQAKKAIEQVEPVFSDLFYDSYEEDAIPWHKDLEDLGKRLNVPLDAAQVLLDSIGRKFWLAFGRIGKIQYQLSTAKRLIAEESQALMAYGKTDFYADTAAPVAQAEARLKELQKLYEQARRLVRFVLIGSGIVFLAIIAIVAAAMFYSIQAHQGSVTVTVKQLEPDDPVPRIVLGSITTNSFTASFNRLQEGQYHLRVTAPGFEDSRQEVVLKSSQALKVGPIEMLPVGGFLRLAAAPGGYHYEAKPLGRNKVAAAGEVAPDDAANLRLRPGRYEVTFSQPDRKFEVLLAVTARDVTRYTPDFRFSKVKIYTQPEGALVSINGSDLGFSPVELFLPPLDHSVTLHADGYDTYYLPIHPEGGQPLTFTVNLAKPGAAPAPPRKSPANVSFPQPLPEPASGLEKIPPLPPPPAPNPTAD